MMRRVLLTMAVLAAVIMAPVHGVSLTEKIKATLVADETGDSARRRGKKNKSAPAAAPAVVDAQVLNAYCGTLGRRKCKGECSWQKKEKVCVNPNYNPETPTPETPTSEPDVLNGMCQTRNKSCEDFGKVNFMSADGIIFCGPKNLMNGCRNLDISSTVQKCGNTPIPLCQ